MAVLTRPFAPAEYLDSDEAIAAYMNEALETGDVSFIADALGVVARAKGMNSDRRPNQAFARELVSRLERGRQSGIRNCYRRDESTGFAFDGESDC